jgi:hypothetical protein
MVAEMVVLIEERDAGKISAGAIQRPDLALHTR